MIHTAKYYTEVGRSIAWRPYGMGVGESGKRPAPLIGALAFG